MKEKQVSHQDQNDNLSQSDMMQAVREEEERKNRRNRIIIIAAVILAALVLMGIIVFGVMNGKEEPAPQQTSQAQTTEAVVYGDEKYGIDPEVDKALKDYRNVVLFGIDTADVSNEAGHRSDGIIIISLNKVSDDVKIFSVYRDTYLKIDDSSFDKINHAYAFGGMDQSIRALNRNLDLNIREGMALTWDAIGNLVDKIGGVEIEVLDSEINEMNKGLSQEDQIISAGVHNLNGNQAVSYSRIRYDSAAGDHRRNERMQAVLIAALNKAKTLDPGELMTIMDETLAEVSTNMSEDEMTEILMEMASYNIKENVCWPYDTQGWMKNSIYYGIPVTLQSNVSKLHEEFFGQEDYDPTDFVKDAGSSIINESGYN